MANRNKSFQDSRVARLNFAVLPDVKDDLITLASMKRITLNELGNQIFSEYIKNNQRKLDAYVKLISGFDNDVEEQPSVKTQQKISSSKTSITVSDEQKNEAINKIIAFVNENKDKIIDEKAKKNKTTIGYRVPARRGKPACIAVIADSVKNIIDKDVLIALKGNKITINGKKVSDLIRIDDPEVIAALGSSSPVNEEQQN